MGHKQIPRQDAVRAVPVTFDAQQGTWYFPARQGRTGVILSTQESPRPEFYAQLADLTHTRVFHAPCQDRAQAAAAFEYLQSRGYAHTVLLGPAAYSPSDALAVLCPREPLEDQARALNRFLDKAMHPRENAHWLRLDNAAKIYPAALRKNWSSLFRLSATLTEDIDPKIMQQALDVTVRRFPSICARLRKGLFWYYLQSLDQAPPLSRERNHPLTRMSLRQIRRCALRVIVYKNRLALELFHSLTDGTGALVFLKTLLAEYLERRYGISVPNTHGILDRMEAPSAAELEDSFQKYGAPKSLSRKSSNAWRLKGILEKDGFVNLTAFTLDASQVRQKAKEYGVGVTAFLTAVMMQALQTLQAEQIPHARRRKSIKVQVPVNLRSLFPSGSLRNFAMYTTPEIQPRLGTYSFQEICDCVHHRMGLEINSKFMGMMIAANIGAERLMAVRLMPLFIKNLVMKAAFDTVGERKYCLAMSNLGRVELPESMAAYVKELDFILGVQATAPYNCGVIGLGNTLRVNFVRNIRQPGLELHFHRALQALGLDACVQSNRSEV